MGLYLSADCTEIVPNTALRVFILNDLWAAGTQHSIKGDQEQAAAITRWAGFTANDLPVDGSQTRAVG